MTEPITINRALADPKLLGAAIGDLSTWQTWLAVLKAAFGITLSRSERKAFQRVAASRRPPKRKVAELWAIVGRRSGKSRMAAAISVFIACFVQHRLDPGERGYCLVLAATADQARVVFGYALGFMQSSPVLATMIETVTADEIRLRNGISIAIHVSSYRHVRGKTLVAVVCDEISYWRSDDSANPDREILRAVAPSLQSCAGMLVAISSPYRKIGMLFERHRDYFGQDDDSVLVISAPTTTLNPTINQKIIDKAHRDDPEAARSEWGAEFRSDISALFTDQVIDDAIDHSRPLELPPRRGDLRYYAFTDASAGRHDAFTICVGHAEGDRFICDAIRGRAAPFDPRTVAFEFAALARSYDCRVLTGDAFAGEWVSAAFKDAGISYQTSRLNRSELYLEALAPFNQGNVSIPKHERLCRELRLLERRVSRAGRDSVDHPQGGGGSDDYANSLVGCLYATMLDKNRGYALQSNLRPEAIGVAGPDGVVRSKPLQRPRFRVVTVTEAESEAVKW